MILAHENPQKRGEVDMDAQGYHYVGNYCALKRGYRLEHCRKQLEETLMRQLEKNSKWMPPLLWWRSERSFFDNPHEAREVYERMESQGSVTREKLIEYNTRYDSCPHIESLNPLTY
jgi:hypothetical protein